MTEGTIAESAAAQAAAAPKPEDQKKLAMLVVSGDAERLLAAYVIATGAAASGIKVDMFFNMFGLLGVKKALPTGEGFFGRVLGSLLYNGGIDNADPSRFRFGHLGRWVFRHQMKRHNVIKLSEVRQLAIDLGVTLYGCAMTMTVLEIPREALIDEVSSCVGASAFINDAMDANQLMVF